VKKKKTATEIFYVIQSRRKGIEMELNDGSILLKEHPSHSRLEKCTR